MSRTREENETEELLLDLFDNANGNDNGNSSGNSNANAIANISDEEMNDYLLEHIDNDNRMYPNAPTHKPIVIPHPPTDYIIPNPELLYQARSRNDPNLKKDLMITRKRKFNEFVNTMFALVNNLKNDKACTCNKKHKKTIDDIIALNDSILAFDETIKLYRGGNYKKLKTKRVKTKRFKMKYSKRKYRL